MQNKYFAAIILSVILGHSNAALAAETCSPAKQLVKAAKAFYGDQVDLRNVITPTLNVGLKGINGHPDPSHLLYRFEGFEYNMPIVDGRLQGLEEALNWSRKGELCSMYEDGPLEDTDENTVSLFVNFGFPFLREDGVLSVDEINEGAKDGTKIIKSFAPPGLGFAAPSLKTIVVAPTEETGETPKLIFMRDGEPKAVPISRFNRTQYVRLKDIKSAKVDSLKIEGLYKVAAFFKIDPDEILEREAKRLVDAQIETEVEAEEEN